MAWYSVKQRDFLLFVIISLLQHLDMRSYAFSVVLGRTTLCVKANMDVEKY